MSAQPNLMNRNFTLLWLGQTVSGLGSTSFTIAMIFWVKHATQSSALMGTLLMVSGLPGVVLGPLGGAFADYFSRRMIIIVTDVLNGLSMLMLGLLYFLRPEATDLILGWIFGVCFLGGILGSFFRPAIAAALPDLVPKEKLLQANLLSQMTTQVVRLLGQALGGVALSLFGALKIFVFNGASFLCSAFSECFIEIPQKPRTIARPGVAALMTTFAADIAEGFRYIWRREGMRNLFVATSAVNFLLAPIGLLLPFYVEDVLAIDTMWYGFMVAAITLGTMCGFYLLRLMPRGSALRRGSLLCLLPGVAVLFLCLSACTQVYGAIALLFAMGCLIGAYNLNNNVVLQTTTDSEIRGRVFGFLGTIVSGVTPLSMALTGYATQSANNNVLLIFSLGGGGLLVLALLITANKAYRSYLTWEGEAA